MLPQPSPLRHAELVLLVDHRQPEVRDAGFFVEQSVRSDEDLWRGVVRGGQAASLPRGAASSAVSAFKLLPGVPNPRILFTGAGDFIPPRILQDIAILLLKVRF